MSTKSTTAHNYHGASTMPAAAAMHSHDLHGIEAALSRVNIDRALGEASNQPLCLPGSALNIMWRKRGLKDLREALSRVQNKYAVLRPGPHTAFNLLLRSLSCVLEQHAAYKAQPRTREGYMAKIKSLREELRSLLGEQAACRDPRVFLEIISPWVAKVQEATAPPDPNAMDAQETSPEDTTWSNPVSAAAATAWRRATAMDAEPTVPKKTDSPLRASTPEDDIELTEEEVKALHPQKTIYGDLHALSYTIRRQGLCYIYKRVKLMNSSVKRRSREWLSDTEIPELTKTMEINILKSLHRDINREPSPPTSQQIENEYTKRVDSKLEECSIFGKFLTKIKRFHGLMKNLQKRALEKKPDLSCFGDRNRDQQMPSPAPIDVDGTRKLFFAALRNILNCMSTGLGNSHNKGQPVLRPDQIENMVNQLEGLVAKEVNRKAEQKLMENDQQFHEYVKLGNEVIDKLKDPDFFVSAVKGCFRMHS